MNLGKDSKSKTHQNENSPTQQTLPQKQKTTRTTTTGTTTTCTRTTCTRTTFTVRLVGSLIVIFTVVD